MELIRRAIRSALGADSRLYAWGASALSFAATVSSDGFGVWRTLSTLSSVQDGPPVPVTLRNLEYPLFIRPGSDDAFTVLNNVIRQEYGHFRVPDAPVWMIDAGACIGDTTAYFLSRFPGLKVLALEPNPENHAVAERNLAPYGQRSILLQKALYARDDRAAITGSGVSATLSTEGREVDCISIPTLLRQYRIDTVDILKMDIEGAELEVLGDDASAWLDRITLLILETHGPQIESRVTEVLHANGFSLERFRSLWYCRRANPGANERAQVVAK